MWPTASESGNLLVPTIFFYKSSVFIPSNTSSNPLDIRPLLRIRS